MTTKYFSDSFPDKDFGGMCYSTHPGLKVGDFTIYGSSASNPIVEDADIYVSLQSGSRSGLASDPWDNGGVVEILFPIEDTCAPKKQHLDRFKKMVTWLCNQLHAGKKIHVGCIGGHGRTGTLLSAIVAEMTGEKDAIQYVRKNYCSKAVESREQVKFLMLHYGVSDVPSSKGIGDFPTKTYSSGSTYSKSSGYSGTSIRSPKHDSVFGTKQTGLFPYPKKELSGEKEYRPMNSGRNLWARKKKKQLTNV